MIAAGRGHADLAAVWGKRLLWLVAIGYIIVIPYTILKACARAEGGLKPTIFEFTPTFGASLQLRDRAADSLYQREPVLEYTQRTLPEMYPTLDPIWRGNVRYPPWLYPPHFIFLVVPLALLPYWWAHGIWVLASALPYWEAIRRILPRGFSLPFALAFPPVFYNALQAQTGFLTAGLIGLGLSLVRRHPYWAGICIGFASIKPHFGLLLPLALVAGAYWRVVVAAGVTVLGLVAISALAFGPSAWHAFFASATANLQGFESSTYNFIPMTTVLSSFALAGMDLGIARIAQFISFLVMMVLVAGVWWRGRDWPQTFGLQCAILCIASPLAVPMAYIYDLVLLAPAVAWIGMDLHLGRARWGEWVVLVGGSGSLLGVVTVAQKLDLQIGPAILAVLMGLALHRFLIATRRSAPCADCS